MAWMAEAKAPSKYPPAFEVDSVQAMMSLLSHNVLFDKGKPYMG